MTRNTRLDVEEAIEDDIRSCHWLHEMDTVPYAISHLFVYDL